MPNQAKKYTSTPTSTEKQTKTKKKKKNTTQKTHRKDSASESSEGRHKKSKSRRGRHSSDSNGSHNGITSNLSSTTTSSRSNNRSTSSSSGENVAVSYQSEHSDLDSRRESCHTTSSNELHEETSTNRVSIKNESLRWTSLPENEDEEDDRIRIYKMNRRKRYMDVLQHKLTDERESQFYA